MSNTEHTVGDSVYGGDLAKLRKSIHRIAPALEHTEFTVKSLGKDVDRPQHTIRFLRSACALSQSGTETIETDNGKKQIPVWKWHEPMRQKLQDHLENRDELSCGHRIALWNPRRPEGFWCKKCMEKGVRKEVSRETIKNNL